MVPHPKRRKLSHGHPGRKHGLIDFEAPSLSRLSNASTFILQTDELLKQVKLGADFSALKSATDLLHRLRVLVESIAPHDPIPLDEASQKLKNQHGITVPFPEPKPLPGAQYKFSFAKPKCNVVGSFVSMTMAQTEETLAVDLVVEMPSELFQAKDFMDMRYFYRRAYFLARIAAELRTSLGDEVELSFKCLHDNPLLPILAIRPVNKPDGGEEHVSDSPARYSVHVMPYAPQGLFRKAKLLPNLCCNRVAEVGVEGGQKREASSQFYNSTVKAEETPVYYMRVLTAAKNKCPAFSDACVLGRIWLRQRGFAGSVLRGGFGNFEWAVTMALLLTTGGRAGQPLLSASLSSTEMFKAMIHFLATTSFVKRPFIFGTLSSAQDSVRETGPVMFDPNTELNILFKMSPWSALWLQQHAKSTTELLSCPLLDSFEHAFITNVDQPLQNFDFTFTVQVAGLDKPPRQGWHHDLGLYRILAKALGARAQLIQIRPNIALSWSLESSTPDTRHSDLTIGIIFNPEHMGRTMEYGPAAEDQKEAEKFRKFWGERAELRRFKNGNILECVEWTKKTAPEICEEIVGFALARHLNISHEHLNFARTAAFASVIRMTHMDRPAFDAAIAAFRTLESDLRGLEGMLLQIRHVMPLSPRLRYASVAVLTMVDLHQESLMPLDVGLSFEASSRWPDNLVAIQHAKIDFLLDIGKRLCDANEDIKTCLGRENVGVGNNNLAFLDIVYPNAAVFRLRILADPEESMLDRQVKNKTMTNEKTRADAEKALQAFRWMSKSLPLHSQAISTHCTRMPPLSPAIRLVKRWFSRHLLSGHFGEELIELFVLHAFLQPYPWRTPSSAATGFLRTLFTLSRWDWRHEPLVVDWSDDGGNTDSSVAADDAADAVGSADAVDKPSIAVPGRADAHHELEAWRKRDPNMNRLVLFVATPHDGSGLAYTRTMPSRLAAMRMTRLATTACRLAKEQGTALDPEALFRTSLRDYDVLFHLAPKAAKAVLLDASTDSGPGGAGAVAVARAPSHFKNLDYRTGKLPLPVARHPRTVLLDELRRVYEDTLVFFYGSGGGGAEDETAIVAAIWHPNATSKQHFRVGLPWNSRAVGDQDTAEAGGDKVELNRDAVLAEIARMGGELIRKIEVVGD